MKKEGLCILLVSAIVSGIFLLPLFPYFFRGIPYTHHPEKGFERVHNIEGDHLQFLYHLALFEKALEKKIPFWSDGYQFSTPWQAKPLILYFPPQGVLFFLFSFIGYAGAYNLLILLSFFISIFGMYYYLRTLELRPFPSFVGAFVYTFFPYRIASLFGGHPAGMMSAYFPLLLFFLEKNFRTRKSWFAFGAGTVLLFFAWSEPHYLYYSFLFIPAYAIFFLLKSRFTHDIAWFSFIKECGGIPFHFDRTRQLRHVNSIFALGSFLFLYLLRREGVNALNLAMAFFSTIAVYYGILCLTILVCRLSRQKDTSYESERISGRLYWFNLFYLYWIQTICDVPHLGGLIALLFIAGYFMPFVKNGVLSIWPIVVPALPGWVRKQVRQGRETLLFIWPLLLFMALSAHQGLRMKKHSIKDTFLEKGRKIEEISLFSPHLSDIVRPHQRGARYVYPGMVPLALVMIFFFLWVRTVSWKRLSPHSDGYHVFFLLMFVFTYLLCFGPHLSMPPLFSLCRSCIPFFDFIRSPIKIIVLASLAFAFLTSYYFDRFLNIKKVQWFVFLLIAGEYYLIQQMGICVLDNRNAVLSRLEAGNKSEKVLYLPLWPGDSSWSSLYQYYSLVTDRFMINGYQPLVPRDYVINVAEPLYSLNLGKVTFDDWNRLRSLGVDEIVFHKEAFPRKVSPFPQRFSLLNLKASGYLEFREEEDPLYLFTVRKHLASPRPSIPSLSSPWGTVEEGERFRHRSTPSCTIVREKSCSLGKALSLTGSNEILIYSDRFYPNGRFKGFIRLQWISPQTGTVRFGVFGPRGKKIRMMRFRLQPRKGFCFFPVNFKVSEPDRYRFMLKKEDKGTLLFDYIYLIFSGQKDPKTEILPSDGIYTGQLKDDEHDGPVVHVDERYPPGPAVFAANRLYAKGAYQARFLMKGEFPDKTGTPMVTLQVTDAWGVKVFAEKKLFPDDFNRKDWTSFFLPFSITEDAVLNFHVRYEGRGELQVKKIVIESANEN
ncbi:MAG: hypothetical protein JW774_05450 [Candidatus Aureabacteria bacterium]|nr:hypothetical protein [Candidatus Auribacterota bacterium]